MTPPTSIKTLLTTHPLPLSPYETLYKHLHTHPELSFQEQKTAATIAAHSALHPYTIHTSIGGHGLAATLSNGSGPTVLLRADMDALPVEEETGLDYASEVRVKDPEGGGETAVMHACGHDMHVTCLLAAADWLAKEEVRREWSGTLVLVFQPAEEKGKGARAMVDGGLYEKVPVPDVVLGQHVMALRTGRVGVRTGTMMAAADSFRVTVFGRGGHGSMPHLTIDPVLLCSNIVVRLQGVVAREVDPQEAAVLTVGSVQAGSTENIIASKGVLKIDIRSQNEVTRGKMFKAMLRIIRKECEASGCEKPTEIVETRKFPLTINDAQVAQQLGETFTEVFGDEFDPDLVTANASEDVSDLATSVNKPCCFWFFGGVDKAKWDQAEKEGRIHEDIPGNHSGYFAPVIQPTMKTGVDTLCAAALTHLGRKAS